MSEIGGQADSRSKRDRRERPEPDISQTEVPRRNEPLTCCSPIRYLVIWLGAADAVRSTETARVHIAARWRSGSVAACGARAAVSDAGNRTAHDRNGGWYARASSARISPRLEG